MNEPSPVRRDRRGCPPGAGVIAAQPKGGEIGRIGNPPHEPTDALRRLVREHSRAGIEDWEIAEEAGFSVSTLFKHYGDDFRSGRREVKRSIGAGVIKRALEGNQADAHFFLRTKGGWIQPQRIEHTGKDGGPIATLNLHAYLEGKSADELAVIEGVIVELLAAGDSSLPGSDDGGAPTGP